MRIVSLLLLLGVTSVIAFADDDQVEFRGEYFFNSERDNCFEFTNEHWPATIEARLFPSDSEEKNWVGLAFSLRSTPKLHEKLRVGLAFDVDQAEDDWLRSGRPERDDRFYLYGRSEFPWATLRLYYPLAQKSRGHNWYWRIEVDDLQCQIIRSGDFTSSAIAGASYSPDPDRGFDYNYGLRFQYNDYWLDATTDYLSIGGRFIK